MSSKVFAPGHITGFFSPSDNLLDMEKIGSKGAGFSVKLGVYAEVEVEGKGWKIYVNDKQSSFMVVEKAISSMAKGGTIRIKTELPFSQGFGMSGACALASAIGACAEMELPRENAVKAAHVAEVFCRTGLGDVVAQSIGGFETRIEPGLPPTGKIVKKTEEKEVVLGISGSPLITPNILADPSVSEWIKLVGQDCMDDFLPENGFNRFCDISKRFALETKFMRSRIEELLLKVEDLGNGSMSMIGNSVFLIGDTGKIYDFLVEKLGSERVYLTAVDNKGARLVD
ncbi:MAG: hypothetical protein R6U17_07560 [Thermoplasmata archaeon]